MIKINTGNDYVHGRRSTIMLLIRQAAKFCWRGRLVGSCHRLAFFQISFLLASSISTALERGHCI